MRVLRGGMAHISGTIEEDLADRKTGLQKPHLAGFADVVACVLGWR